MGVEYGDLREIFKLFAFMGNVARDNAGSAAAAFRWPAGRRPTEVRLKGRGDSGTRRFRGKAERRFRGGRDLRFYWRGDDGNRAGEWFEFATDAGEHVFEGYFDGQSFFCGAGRLGRSGARSVATPSQPGSAGLRPGTTKKIKRARRKTRKR